MCALANWTYAENVTRCLLHLVSICVSVWAVGVNLCVCLSVDLCIRQRFLRLVVLAAAQPRVTFSHEGVAYDTSSGFGQTSSDPSSDTPAWFLPSPVFPFCSPTATLLPPLPFSQHWTFSHHPNLISSPWHPVPATAGLNLQVIGTFALFEWAWMLQLGGKGPEKTVCQTEIWRMKNACFQSYAFNSVEWVLLWKAPILQEKCFIHFGKLLVQLKALFRLNEIQRLKLGIFALSLRKDVWVSFFSQVFLYCMCQTHAAQCKSLQPPLVSLCFLYNEPDCLVFFNGPEQYVF